jgi:drug/metabolite transporter (DMT)-like permease
MSSPWFDRLAPIVFVLIWSTGWIAAGYAAQTSDPLAFLATRFALAAATMAAIATASGARWPSFPRRIAAAAIAGVLLHALYLGPLWWAIRHGVPASISGLLASLQPILTVALAPALIGERIAPRQWLGVAIGALGLTLVLLPKLAAVDGAALKSIAMPLLVNVAGMVFVTLGSFFQKRFVASGDLRTTAAIQYIAAAAVVLPAAFALGEMRIGTDAVTLLTMAWSVLALSIGAILLLLALIRRGAVARSAALIYLIPPTVAGEAWLFFGETLAPIQIAGMALTVIGVALASPRVGAR